MIRNRPQRRKPRPIAAWVGLAYATETGDIWIASMAKTKAAALLKVECRIERVSKIEAFPINDAMGPLVMVWLKSLGATEPDAVQAVREIGRQMVEMFS